MDRAGRVVIPRTVREKYGLVDGIHKLDVLESVEGIVLMPSLEEITAERHPSSWIVFHSGDSEVIDPARVIEEDRRHRYTGHRRSRVDIGGARELLM